MRDFLDVLAFHEKFDLPRSEHSAVMDSDLFDFRWRFLHEELGEFGVAWHQENLVAAADSLIDFVYVCIGTALFIGVPRYNVQSSWPTFATVKKSTIRNGILDEDVRSPHLLSAAWQQYYQATLRRRVECFGYAYQVALVEPEGALEQVICTLKSAIYEAYQAAAMMNIPWERCWCKVQKANMAKVTGISKRKARFDVIKPTGWVAPDAAIATELRLDGWSPPFNMQIDNITGKVTMT